MILDFYHNKIVADTVSEGFISSFKASLLPKLSEKYPSLIGIQMYEDFLSENLKFDGFAYYPLTVISEGGFEICWIRWDVSDASSFDGGVCYAYKKSEGLLFEIADKVPSEFLSVTENKRMYFGGDVLPIHINTVIESVKLSGKYSQSFLDTMAYAVCRSPAISTSNRCG